MPGSLNLLARAVQGQVPAQAAAVPGVSQVQAPGQAPRRQSAVVTLSHAAVQPDSDSDDDDTDVFFDSLPAENVESPADVAGGGVRHRYVTGDTAPHS